MTRFPGLDTLDRAAVEDAIETLAELARDAVVGSYSAHRHNGHGQYAAALAALTGSRPEQTPSCDQSCDDCDRFPAVFEYRSYPVPDGHGLGDLRLDDSEGTIYWSCQCGAGGAGGPGGWGEHRRSLAREAAGVTHA